MFFVSGTFSPLSCWIRAWALLRARAYIKWRMNTEYVPVDPKERGELLLKMLGMVKADMEAKSITKWGMCYDASEGYAFSKLGVQELYTLLAKWTPYVEFDVKPGRGGTGCRCHTGQSISCHG